MFLALGCGDASFVEDASAGDAKPGPSDAATNEPGPSEPGPGDDAGAAADTAAGAVDGAEEEAGAAPVDAAGPRGKATVVVLPDTQYYAASYNSVFHAQTNWIAAQKPVLDVAAVLHVGDIVDADNAPQWAVAKAAMSTLDQAAIPYLLVPGNHDYGDANRGTKIDTYFGPAAMPWITGTMTAGQIENSYALFAIGSVQWLVLGLEFGPRDAVMTWADKVLAAYPDRPAIIVTHAYLYHDGHRYDIDVSGGDPSQPSYQAWIPQFYGYTASQGINDGERIWQKLVLPHPNVRLVFCGHDTGYARLSSRRPDGSVVHQMLSDFQWYRTDQPDYYGGGGYLRILHFDYDRGQISVETYSPYLDTHLGDEQNQFTLDL